MMDYFQVLVLSVIQGFTEWLPVSSSGHLVIAQKLMGLTLPVAFDVVLHIGTLVAVVVFMWGELVFMFKSILSEGSRSPQLKVVGYVVLATIPAVVVGLLFKKALESMFESLYVVSGGLLLTGLLLFIGEKNVRSTKLDSLRAFIVGVFQAVAIIPGVSRSGSTIGVGMMLGLSRQSAAKFSFLMSMPVILGAAVLEVPSLADSAINPSLMCFGFVVSAIVGYLSLQILWTVISSKKLTYFAYYCWLLGVILLISDNIFYVMH